MLNILIAARKLISDSARWTRWSYARDISGHQIDPKSPGAVSWCAIGALERVAGYDQKRSEEAYDALCIYCVENTRFRNIALLNDYSDHAEVLRVFDGLIEEGKL